MTSSNRRFAHWASPVVTLLLTCAAFGQGDPEVIERIIREGKDNSRVWVYVTYLSEEIGPRLTGSARLERANNWTREMFESFGCSNAHLQQWGEIPVRFDRGPSYCRIVGPGQRDLEFTARSWSAGTNGPVKGRVVKQPATMAELEAMRDQLKGAWVLAKPPRGGRGGRGGATTGPATGPATTRSATRATTRRGGGGGGEELMGAADLVPALYAAGIAGRITPSGNDLVLTGGERNWRDMKYDALPTDVTVVIPRKDYDTLNSRLADGESPELEVNLDHRFSEGPIPVYNTIAEIPGTEFPEQVVIVSAHLDSWDGPGAQGAQDNGTGSAVTLEAARILMAAGVKPRRTIRFCLWTGEEQGLLGSREYVKQLTEAEQAGISAVFVDDGGTNYQGGLVGVVDMEAMLVAAVEPVNRAFPTMPVSVTTRPTMPRGGGSDHASFNRVGIPGFFWTETGSGGREGKNYTFIHHTQHDTTRYAVPEYLVQSATCSAIAAYNLAMADELLPRAPIPTTQPTTSPSEPEGPEFVAAPGPLTGTWTADIVRDGNVTEGAFTFTLEHATDGRLRGQMFSRFGEGRLRRIDFNPGSGGLTFGFSLEEGGMTRYAVTVKGESMSGTLNNEEMGFSAPFTARRTSSEAQPPTVR